MVNGVEMKSHGYRSYKFKITTNAPVHDTCFRTIYSDDFNKAVLAVAGEAYPFGLKAIEYQLELYTMNTL